MAWNFKKLMKMEFAPLMKFLIEMYEPDIYVEVGVERGETFNQISPLVKESYAVDINPIPLVDINDGVNVCVMPSSVFAEQWDKDKKIDLLFIDGDHKKDSVLADFKALSPFITPQTGLILLHDTYPAAKYLLKSSWCSSAWEAARLIHEHSMFNEWEIVTLPGPYAGLSIIRNAKKHLHWQKE